MQRLGLIVNHKKPRTPQVLRALGETARKMGLVLYADAQAVDWLGDGSIGCDQGGLAGCVEGVLALGGDGTMLSAARMLNGAELPILGINLGSLGYLTSVQIERLDEALHCLRNDAFTICRRAKLTCTVFNASGKVSAPDALNDVVVSRGGSGRVVWLDVSIDGAPVSTYVCDGLIVSTPTGSTPYSMSAGGPIVMPGTPAMVISVICPHTLSSRPLVVPDSVRIEVIARQASGSMLVSVDGQDDHVLDAGQRVVIRRSEHRALFALLPGHDAFAVLRHKLGWGDVGREFA